MSSAFTVMPVPAITFNVAAPDVAPPVIPVPATTDVISPVSGVNHSSVPLVFDVLNACPLPPTAAGKVAVHDADTVPGACNATY